MAEKFAVLGAGYTGQRVAERLKLAGHDVTPIRSDQFDVLDPATHAHLPSLIPEGARVLHSVPVLRTDTGYRATMAILSPLLNEARIARLVYLSTTGVYGEASHVDESTPVAPRHQRERMRVEEEQAVLNGPWQGLVLRPAAIYGPGRGIQESMRLGTYKLLAGGHNYISRIHVDDLAAIATAALRSDLEGAFPVADEKPCPALEIAQFCTDSLNLSFPPSVDALPDEDTRRSDRRVDGRAIAKRLDLTLRYPSYRQGIPASVISSQS